ncbi:hypothetical protein KAX21_01640 [candidate division WOR-3 bacterium]|nr:hypothetical protein [candidate division WOR-3 bacterium]
MAVHRCRGEPCPRCGTKVQWVSTTSRDTFYCPRCQTPVTHPLSRPVRSRR